MEVRKVVTTGEGTGLGGAEGEFGVLETVYLDLGGGTL